LNQYTSFKTYIYRIAKNKAFDIVRRKKREEKLAKILSLNFFQRQDDPEELIIKGE